jgi:hypothetical protein
MESHGMKRRKKSLGARRWKGIKIAFSYSSSLSFAFMRLYYSLADFLLAELSSLSLRWLCAKFIELSLTL